MGRRAARGEGDVATGGRRSGRFSRSKGVAGERDFARAWQAAGWTVRGLERGGDLWLERDGVTLHGEAKRQERPQVSWWVRQVERDVPPGVPWVLGFRASREPWTAVLRLDTFLALDLGDALPAMLGDGRARAFHVGEAMYVRLPLEALLEALA